MPAEDHHILKTYFPASASYSFTFNVFFWSLICSWETSLLEQVFISPHELMSIGCKHWAALISLHEYMSSTGHWAPRELMGAVMSPHVLPGATRPLSTWHQLQLHLWKAHWTCCMRNCLSWEIFILLKSGFRFLRSLAREQSHPLLPIFAFCIKEMLTDSVEAYR